MHKLQKLGYNFCKLVDNLVDFINNTPLAIKLILILLIIGIWGFFKRF